MQPSTVNGTGLGAQEWCDALFLCYSLDTPDLPKYCDGCNTKFTICQALNCKRGGLVAARHNDLWNRVADLDGKDLISSHVRNDPLIFAGCAVQRPKAKSTVNSGSTDQEGTLPPEATEQKEDLLIRGIWQNSTDSVHDMRVMNTDAKTHFVKTPEKCLQEAERGKKRMYLEACFQQGKHLSPFVALVDGLLGVEATATLKRSASSLATKWRQPYYKTCGYINSRIAITLVLATHCCMRGSRVMAHWISKQRPQ